MALSRMNHWQRACALTGIVVFLVALMGGLLAAVAGGGGSLAVAAPSSTSGGSKPGSGSAQLPAAVKVRAERSLVHASDVPPGWITVGAVTTSRTSPWSRQLAGCIGVPSHLARIEPTKFSSPSYGSADHTAAVEDSVSVYPTRADAKAALEALANGKTPRCMNTVGSQALRQSVQNEAGTGVTVGNITIAKLTSGSYLPGQTGYTVTIPLASSGRQLTITSTAIEFVRGRFVHQLTFNGNGVPFPALLQVHMTQLAESRG